MQKLFIGDLNIGSFVANKREVNLGSENPMNRCLNIVMFDDGTHIKIVGQYNTVKSHLVS